MFLPKKKIRNWVGKKLIDGGEGVSRKELKFNILSLETVNVIYYLPIATKCLLIQVLYNISGWLLIQPKWVTNFEKKNKIIYAHTYFIQSQHEQFFFFIIH